jgi:hypothetical protein
MKPFLIWGAVVLGALAYIKALTEEHDRIYNAAYHYAFELCGENTDCGLQVRDNFGNCFREAYSSGGVPGHGGVHLETFAGCMSRGMQRTKLVVVYDKNTVPFPAK